MFWEMVLGCEAPVGRPTAKRFQNMMDPARITSKLVNLPEYIKFIRLLSMLTQIDLFAVLFHFLSASFNSETSLN